MGGSRGKNSFGDVKLAVLVSFLAWPILYLINNGFERVSKDNRTLVMMVTGFVCLFSILATVAKISKSKNPFGYVFILFSFTSMVDLIIGIEYHGYIVGFMSQYLQMGEPYLHSPWGSAISLFDGTGFFAIYLILLYQISNGKSWRSVGIYWASAIINSMIVLILGIFSGRHSPTACIFLNIPYILLPIIAVIYLFRNETGPTWREEGESGFKGKVQELLVATGILFSIYVTFVKGMLSLGSTFEIFLNFLQHEPALRHDDPAPFAKIQSFLFLFYILPIQLISLFYIFLRKKPQFLTWDLGLMHAGIMLQAQFTFIMTAFDPQLKKEMKSDFLNVSFWIQNLSILIVPHAYLWLLYNRHVVQKSLKQK